MTFLPRGRFAFLPCERVLVISQTADYALRAIVHLAYCAPAIRTTEQISLATKVPTAYLSKVLQILHRAGFIHSQRGSGGGMSLEKSADQITVLDIINAIEPIKRYQECPIGLVEHKGQLCGLHRRIDEVVTLAEDCFSKMSVEEIASEQIRRSVFDCPFPCASERADQTDDPQVDDPQVDDPDTGNPESE